MNKRTMGGVLAFWVLVAWGCSGFEDPTPENVFFTVDGPAGAQVLAIYSTQFVAGVDEFGTTGVTIFKSDTVLHTLPIDTTMNIAIDRQWVVVLQSVGDQGFSVEAIVDVDDRNVARQTGGILPGEPWSFVYMFNRRLTNTIEVII